MAAFGLESLYVAGSAGYPMVFDENTQFGVIKLYAHHISPVFLHQPANAAFAGPLTSEPSYLYQYLLSFPYRLLSGLTSSQTIQIVGLRIISILLFGLGIVLFRKLLRAIKIPASITNLSLLLLILLPVTPLLAGQINYDNLVMPVTAAALLLAVQVTDSMWQKKQLLVARLAGLLIICLLGSLVQFEFLPIFVAILVWVAWVAWRQRHVVSWEHDWLASWRELHWFKAALLVFGLVVSSGLFMEMYSVNVVRYHNPTPSCSQVLSVQTCSGYAPWDRDQIDLTHKSVVSHDPVRYTAGWAYRMLNELFYTSSGGASQQAYYLSINPLPVPFLSAVAFGSFGVVLLLIYGRRLAARYPQLAMLCAIAGFYTLLLLVRNYGDYLHVGQKIAINGRYILPVLVPFMAAILLSYHELLRHVDQWLTIGLGIVGLLLMLQGGGGLTYLVVSNSYWYWPSQAVIRVNHDLQRIVRPLVIDKTPLRPRD